MPSLRFKRPCHGRLQSNPSHHPTLSLLEVIPYWYPPPRYVHNLYIISLRHMLKRILYIHSSYINYTYVTCIVILSSLCDMYCICIAILSSLNLPTHWSLGTNMSCLFPNPMGFCCLIFYLQVTLWWSQTPWTFHLPGFHRYQRCQDRTPNGWIPIEILHLNVVSAILGSGFPELFGDFGGNSLTKVPFGVTNRRFWSL